MGITLVIGLSQFKSFPNEFLDLFIANKWGLDNYHSIQQTFYVDKKF